MLFWMLEPAYHQIMAFGSIGYVYRVMIVIALGHVCECVLKFYLQFENMTDNALSCSSEIKKQKSKTVYKQYLNIKYYTKFS